MIFARALRAVVRRFAADENGNIAVIFAIVLVPLLSFVGAAIDYSRANNARTAMQAAADSAALMVSKDLATGIITSDQITAKANAYFKALYTNTDVTGVTVAATYTAKDAKGNSTVDVSTAGSIATNFMKVAGYPNLALSSGSTAKWGGTRQRVAIALDVTGSMNFEGKMDAMKKAAKSLIDTLKAMSSSNDDVYVSIVPFAQFVNVGVANKNADWIKWTKFGKCTFNSNKFDSDTNAAYNAYVSRFASDESCLNFVANGDRATWTSISSKNSWTGCVIDRDESADTTKEAPTLSSTDYPAAYSFQYANVNSTIEICPAQILPMTPVYSLTGTDSSTDTSTIKGKINSLGPNGGTNQAIGMAWAWMSLQTGVPLNTPAKDPNFQYTDSIILLSDGLNTISRKYGDGVNPAPQVDARQKLLCQNIKAPEPDAAKNMVSRVRPQMFTIQVNTDGDDESDVLKYCADTGNFYSTNSASGLAGIFNAIGTSLAKLRVAK